MSDKRYVAVGKVPGKTRDGQVWAEDATEALEDFIAEYGTRPEKVLYETSAGDFEELNILDISSSRFK